LGSIILQPITELKDAILGVKYHHERFDGSGYPEGLKGSEIPFLAAIISVADAFDAMITDRPYRKSLSKNQAVQEVMRYSGTQFNPSIVNAFLEVHQEGKI
jgi:HD-GYP domain-containing protein (c-di-GMP phosphodiesterase class II)